MLRKGIITIKKFCALKIVQAFTNIFLGVFELQTDINEEQTIEKEEDFILDYEKTLKVFSEGDLIKGTVVKIDRDGVLVDVGYKSEGIIPKRELSIRSDVDPADILSVGDEIEVMVLQVEDREGRLVLSRRRVETEKAWKNIELAKGEEKVIEGDVIEVVKGGLILDIGVRGFLPASLVELKRVDDLGEYVGKRLACKIVELNKARNSVVLSRKALLETDKKGVRRKILEKLERGQIVTGEVTSIVDFGAFVNVGGVDGLIHISELCWDHIKHPSEIISVGDKVKVQILDIDLERERLSLSSKQTQEDPWKERIKGFSIGDEIEGKIVRIVPFGAFVQFGEGLEGLIHLSELAEEQVKFPEEVVKVRDEVKARIIEIDVEKRRMGLSLKSQMVEDESEIEAVAETVPEVVVEEKVVIEETSEEIEKIAKEEIPKTAKETVPEAVKEEKVTEIVEETPDEVKEESKHELIEEEKEPEPEPEPGTLEAILAEMRKERQQN